MTFTSRVQTFFEVPPPGWSNYHCHPARFSVRSSKQETAEATGPSVQPTALGFLLWGSVDQHNVTASLENRRAVRTTYVRPLTPSLPWCHLKTTDEIAKFETFEPLCLFFFFFSQQHFKGFSLIRVALKVDVMGPEKQNNNKTKTKTCLQARPCILHPGNITGWGSDGVNNTFKKSQWPYAITEMPIGAGSQLTNRGHALTSADN